MNIKEKKKRHDLYSGFLFYSIGNCKNAFKYLKETNQELNEAWNSGKTNNLNELGEKDRVFKDYLILKIAGLFDSSKDTISLLNFAYFLEKEFSDGKQFFENLELIREKYKTIIERIIKNRHKVVAHTDDKELHNLIHMQDLLDMPIPQLLKEIEDLLASVSCPIFPIGKGPCHVI